MQNINRRQFIYSGAAFFCAMTPLGRLMPLTENQDIAFAASDIRGHIFKNDAPRTLWQWSREGLFYTKMMGDKVVCGICPNKCVLSPGDRSICRSRINYNGKLYSLTYGNPCAVNVDPIEKKPLYHFKPRTSAFSIATTGCSFRCLNCQNWEISQAKPHEVRHSTLFPKDVIKSAEQSSAASIAYTYSEATTFYEYMLDIARLAKEKNIANLWISNGYINHEPLLELCNVLDAANINLKAYSDDIYKTLNGGRLEPVLNTFKTLHDRKIHFEMTNLVVPGYTDDDDMVKNMCHWILENLGPDYPLHFLRFFPQYKLERLAPTPVSTLDRLRTLAMKQGIHYVYLGNVPNHDGNHTFCHNCRKLLIKRQGFYIPVYNLNGNQCRFCGTKIPGVWG